MKYFEKQKKFDENTGEPIYKYEEAGVFCDFTGKFAEFSEELGPEYRTNYMSIDPCAGCLDCEYYISEKRSIDPFSLLRDPYVFLDNGAYPIFDKIMEAIRTEGFQPYSFDQVFRWCRVRTLERLLDQGYSIDNFNIEKEEDE